MPVDWNVLDIPAAKVCKVVMASLATICVPPTVVTVMTPAPLFVTTNVGPDVPTSAAAFGRETVKVLAVQSIAQSVAALTV